MDLLIEELKDRMVVEDSLADVSCNGHIGIDGSTAAVAIIVHGNGRQAVLYIGLRSILDVDRYHVDEKRVVSDVRRRRLVRNEDAATLEAAVLDYLACRNHLEPGESPVDIVAAELGIRLAPRNSELDLRHDQDLDNQAFDMAHADGAGGDDFARIRHNLMRERAIELRAAADAGSADALYLDALLEDIQQKERRAQDWSAKRERLDAWIGQMTYSLANLEASVAALESAGRFVAIAGQDAGRDQLVTAFRNVDTLIPRRAPRIAADAQLFAACAVSDAFFRERDDPAGMPIARSLLGTLIDEAYTASDEAFDTDREKASEVCLEYLKSAYQDVKRWIFRPHDERTPLDRL